MILHYFYVSRDETERRCFVIIVVHNCTREVKKTSQRDGFIGCIRCNKPAPTLWSNRFVFHTNQIELCERTLARNFKQHKSFSLILDMRRKTYGYKWKYQHTLQNPFKSCIAKGKNTCCDFKHTTWTGQS